MVGQAFDVLEQRSVVGNGVIGFDATCGFTFPLFTALAIAAVLPFSSNQFGSFGLFRMTCESGTTRDLRDIMVNSNSVDDNARPDSCRTDLIHAFWQLIIKFRLGVQTQRKRWLIVPNENVVWSVGCITIRCTRSTHSGGCEVVSFSFVPGDR